MSTPSDKNVVTSTLPESTSSLGAALAVGHMPSIAEAIINHNELGNLVLQHFLDRIDQECTTLCQRKLEPISPFRKIHVDKFPTFQWKSLIEHLSSIAPTLFRLLSTISSHSDHRNKKLIQLTILVFVWLQQSSWKREIEKCVGYNHSSPFFCTLPTLTNRYENTLIPV